jgi:3-oxoacyl-[acyl-carrier protein] reductase
MSGRVSFDFAGQTVLVTGGSNGIGLAIARAFHEAGAQVSITGTRSAATDYDHPFEGLAYQQLRVEDCASVQALIGGLDRLDVLVNCAGATMRGQEYEPEAFEAVVRINLLGSQCAAVAALPLLEQVGGTVLNIASMSSYFGFPRVPAYGASKTAIVSLTKSLACAWAAVGVRVNALAPGFIVTNLTERVRSDEQLSATILGRTPAGRFGQPEEMAPMALFLCSDAAQFVTGVTVPVDGGFAASGL